MRMTTHTYQTVLTELHAAKASASLDPITTYHTERRKLPKADKLDPRGPRVGPPRTPRSRRFRPKANQGKGKNPGHGE
jgi:hypothetical protein